MTTTSSAKPSAATDSASRWVASLLPASYSALTVPYGTADMGLLLAVPPPADGGLEIVNSWHQPNEELLQALQVPKLYRKLRKAVNECPFSEAAWDAVSDGDGGRSLVRR